MSDITVRIGADASGVAPGVAPAKGAVEGFGATVQKTREAARAFAQEVRRAFQAPSSNIGGEAQKAATGMDRAKTSAQGASREARNFQRDIRGAGQAAAQAAPQIDRAAASTQRLERGAGSARGAVGALATALSLIGVRQATQEFQDAAFAQFGFESALTATTGGARQARAELSYIEETAGDLGLVLRDSVDGFVALSGATKGTVLQGQATRDIWSGLVTAGVALNRSNEQLKRGQEALVQIASKGVVSMEEIRQQLSEAIPGAVQIGARALGLTTAEFNKMVAEGKLLSEDFLPKFAAQLRREFGPTLEQAMNTPLGRARRELAAFKNATFEVQQAAGRGFLSEMTVGLRELNRELSSPEGLRTAADLGETLGEAFTAAARGAIFLADNIDAIVMGAQLLAGGMLVRWLVVTAAEAKAAAVAYSLKGAAARAAGAQGVAAAAQEAGANVSLRAGLQAAAAAEVQKAEAALVAAKAHLAATNAIATEARQTLAATSAGVAYVDAKLALTRANAALIAAESGVAAAAGRVAVAQGVATASTTAMASAMTLARGAASSLLALVGGPWGAAFLAAGAAIYFTVRANNEAAEAIRDANEEARATADAYRRQAEAAKVLGKESGDLASDTDVAAVAAAQMTGETDKLADAHYRAAAAAKAQAVEELRLAAILAGKRATEATEAFQRRQSTETRRARGPYEPGSGAAAAGGALVGLPSAEQTGARAALASTEYQTMTLEANNARTAAEQLRAEIERPLASYLPDGGSGAGGGGGGGGGRGRSGPDRVSVWQNELDAMIVAEGDFFGESTAREIAFWEQKRALTAAGSDDRLQIDRKLFNLRRQAANDDLRADLEDLQTRQQMAQGNLAEQMRLQDEILDRVRAAYGEDSREYQRALQDKVRLQQEAAAEQLRIEQDRLDAEARYRQATADADAAIEKTIVENAEANADFLADLGLISDRERNEARRAANAELREIERESAETQYQIARQLLVDRLALENLLPEERRRLNGELEALDREHAQRTRIMTAEHARGAADDVRDAMREAAEAWRSAASIAGNGVGDMLNNAVTNARSFGEVWQGIGTQALNAITGAVGRMVERWIMAQFAMTTAEAGGETARTAIKAASVAGDIAITSTKTGVHLTGEGVKTAGTAAGVAARTGIEATGAATSIGLSASVALADVANSAVRAAAGAYAAIAGIPVIGPVLAPVTAAAALAAVLALGKSVFSARGGAERVANDGDMYELHKDEMVLPASIATPLRSAIPRMTVGPIGQALGGNAAGAEARQQGEARSADMMQALGMLAAGGAGGDTFNISALDARSVKRLFEQHGDDLRRAGERQSRDLKVDRP